MKKLLSSAGAILTSALVLSSCVAPYPPGPGTAVGGTFGAAAGGIAGAIIGNQSCRPLEGALIGSAVGALAGSAVGYASDVDHYRYYGAPPGPGYRGYYSPYPSYYRRSAAGYGYYRPGPRYYYY